MPCIDAETSERLERDRPYRQAYEEHQKELKVVKDRLDCVTQLLCKQCMLLSQPALGGEYLIHPDVLPWWNEHKEADRKRLEKEERNRQFMEQQKSHHQELVQMKRRELYEELKKEFEGG
jgi:hypothetical protein